MARSIGTRSLVRQLGAWRGADHTGEVAYRRLAAGLRLLILDGRLPLDVRLPGERELAGALGVSRTTVSAAFAVLREEGYLASRHGSGSRTRVPLGPGGTTDGPRASVDAAGLIDLRIAALPAGEAVHAAYAQALRLLPAHLPGHGYQPVGLPALRAVIAERYARRGLPTTLDEILVTNGAQHALALVLRRLAGPGDRVVIDHPTYPHAIDAIRRASGLPVPVALAATSWDADGLAAAFRQTGPRLAYLVADCHNPTGACMTAATRERVAAVAAQTRTPIVADETLADLWLDAPPPPPLAAFAAADAVVTLGSMAKSHWGGLRVGWIRADAQTVAGLAAARASLDLGTPILEQLAAAVLLAGDDEALEARRVALRAGRDHLLALLATHLPDWRTTSPPGGASLWAELPVECSSALAVAGERHGVGLTAGPRFGVEGAFERFVRLPFTLPDAELTVAVERLSRAYAQLRVGPRATGGRAAAPTDAVV